MTCPACASDRGFQDGVCLACGAAAPATVRCPKCRAEVLKSEKFCDHCGAKIPTRADRARMLHRQRERQDNQQKISRGRRWMLIVAVLTVFGGVFTYFSGKSEVEKEIASTERELEGMTPAERDAQFKASIGMTWQEAVEHDRGMVAFQSGSMIVLGLVFFGLWWWAQSNAFAAALTALLLYFTFLLVGALIDPSSLLKGLIVKGLVVVALFSAMSAAHRERSVKRRPVLRHGLRR